MPYIIILKVRKFRQSTANHFSTARPIPVERGGGGGHNVCDNLSITVDCKVFQMMPDIIILKVRKFRQPTANRFSTARKNL